MNDMLNGKSQNVYRLPPPVCPKSGEPVNLRIPPVEKAAESQVSSVMFQASKCNMFHKFKRL